MIVRVIAAAIPMTKAAKAGIPICVDASTRQMTDMRTAEPSL
jgi:hypothetical protein